MFLDEAVAEFASGRGGDGAATFHREKHVPRGGPNGADGGRGGDVVLVADRSKRTLYDFQIHPKIAAESGGSAHGNKSGKDGKDVEIRVPVGTLVWESEPSPGGSPPRDRGSPFQSPEPSVAACKSRSPIADLSVDGMRFIVCKGGRGGKGNLHYTSSIRQTPGFAEKGEPGECLRARLELKLLADVGLIGLPNAGKSTLIGAISAAKPRIADYPFTTLTPNLGVVLVGDETFTVADMPGLIEGASSGHGLGHRFLRHVERCAALVHLVELCPLDGSEPLDNFRKVERELAAYSEEMAAKPRLAAMTKVDAAPDFAVSQEIIEREFGCPVFVISAVTGQGLQPLLFAMLGLVRSAAAEPAPEVIRFADRRPPDASWEIRQVNGEFALVGDRLERMVAMTNLENDEALRHLHKRLERMGVIGRLRELGAEEGDTVRIGDLEFAFSDEA